MDYKTLPYDQLKALHREIGEHLLAKKPEALDEFRAKMEANGFTAADLVVTKPKANGVKYRNEEGETWSGGRGRRPQWVIDLEKSGGNIEDYRVAS